MKVYITITHQVPEEALYMLQEAGYQVVKAAQVLTRKELLEDVHGADAIFSGLTTRIDRELIDAAGPQLKIIANYAVGFDNIDLAVAKARGIAVTNTPVPEVSIAVAEHTMALILGLGRRVVEADTYAKGEKYQGWDPQLLVGTQVYGKTLGIIGLGRIGKSLAERAVKGFKMKVVYTNPHRDAEFERIFGGVWLPLEKLLQESDFISLHVPLSPATHHMISTEQFSLMKKTAFLINTARGPVVDEKALLRALKTKRIAGAALDVYECEPHIDCDITDHLELKAFSNVILTPHIASATLEARVAMARCAGYNIIAVLSGHPPLNPAV